MQSAEAHITTDRASRYLVQLCRHAGQMGHGLPADRGHGPHPGGDRPKDVQTEWSATEGTISLDWGICTLRATPEGLTLRVEAVDEDRLQRIQAILTRNLTRMGRRDALTVDWRRPDGTTAPVPATTPPRRSRHLTLGLAVAAVLAVAVHAGLAVGVLAIPQWAGLGTDAVLAIILVMVLAKAGLVVAHLRRRRTSAKAH
ncbi:DUF2218 domain-containing protein [Nonomuraea aurantiaca]|uniref:DUF2218 domain-containing protein n=1 Tax=Nonomuraea aurantiaca TaxID=2878562 RepID=UPI0021E66B67|nr:DUF2218 domain-containing protein [Nonomuraea aurantiaca]